MKSEGWVLDRKKSVRLPPWGFSDEIHPRNPLKMHKKVDHFDKRNLLMNLQEHIVSNFDTG